MCVPIGIALAAASTVTSIAGQFVQGKAAYTNAKYQQSAANANAALADDQAKQEIDATKLAAQRNYREAGALEGKQQAAMAANGIDTTFGSAAQVKSDSRMLANEDAAQIYKEGFNKTQGYVIDAYNEKLKAGAARSAARGAGWATGIGMLGTALGGASQISKMNASFG
jgi:hypothetical protein